MTTDTNTFEHFYTMQDLPLWSMWYKGESVGRLQIKMLLIRKGIDGGNHTVKQWREIFSGAGIVFENPTNKNPRPKTPAAEIQANLFN